jgi:phosphoglycolate phosphatase/AHBA synthesis associated protein
VLHLTANKNEVTALGEALSTPKAILFDMDGVLLDSKEAWVHTVSAAGRRFRGREIPREEFLPTFGQGTASDVRTFGLSCTTAELDQFYVEEMPRHAEHVWVDPEAAPLLRALRERGLRLSVVTNTVSPLAQRLLEAAKLRELFDFVACADQVPRAKPAPDLARHACAQLGVAPAEAWMIGDSRFDRGCASAAGVRFIGMKLDGDERVEHLRELGGLVR